MGGDEGSVEVGFLLGSTADGITAVADPSPTRHTSPTAIAYARLVRAYIRLHSRLPAWDKRVAPSFGFWRTLTVREGRSATFLPAPQPHGQTSSIPAGGADPGSGGGPEGPSPGVSGTAAPLPLPLPQPLAFGLLSPLDWLVVPDDRCTGADSRGGCGGGGDSGAGSAGGAGSGGGGGGAGGDGEEAGRDKGGGAGAGGAAGRGTAGGGAGGEGSGGVRAGGMREAEPRAPPQTDVLVMVQVVRRENETAQGSQFVFPVTRVSPDQPDVLVKMQVNDAFTSKADMTREARALAAHVQAGARELGLPRMSLVLQMHSGPSSTASPDARTVSLLDGSPPECAGHICESLCELRFRVHPAAFLQVNTAAACLRYKLLSDWVAAPSVGSTLLLDICCSTGAIGVTMARSVAKVVGIDIAESACTDAAHNAALNGLINCEYVAGKAEVVLPQVLEQHAASYDHVIAVADPPRPGLHASVLRTIVTTRSLRRLVYISSNPTSLAHDLAELCGPSSANNRHLIPSDAPRFTLTRAVALDLCPHTPHVEAVVLLERA
ncbi:hypothetical protein FOA52_012278 [Chlamydomonas sp. UWO 241]|nr:hypothetical protein FOA52_012278 [Chlamydomonas sp. UWO 241]